MLLLQLLFLQEHLVETGGESFNFRLSIFFSIWPSSYLASRIATIHPEHSDSEVARNSYCRKFSRRYEIEKQCWMGRKHDIIGLLLSFNSTFIVLTIHFNGGLFKAHIIIIKYKTQSVLQ